VLDSFADSAAVFGGLAGCRFVAEGLRIGRKWPKSIPIRCASMYDIRYVVRISWLCWASDIMQNVLLRASIGSIEHAFYPASTVGRDAIYIRQAGDEVACSLLVSSRYAV
jgi:hypothetical protein